MDEGYQSAGGNTESRVVELSAECVMKTWRHQQNRKYTMYCIATRAGMRHGHI